MSFIFPPGDFIYYQKIKEHKDIKKKFFSKIQELSNNEEVLKNKPFKFCIFKTSIFKPELNSFLLEKDILDLLVWNPIDKLIEKYNENNIFKINLSESIVEESWFNIYEKTNFQEIHDHWGFPKIINNEIYQPSFSLIYILEDKNEGNSTVFKFDRNNFMYNFGFNSTTIDTSKIKNISEGTVIIFPYTFEHFVIPVVKDRISIAYNISSKVIPRERKN